MAVTKTHPIKSTLKAAIDYICNPEKTDGKLLVSSYGCAAETADIEFSWTRRHAIDKGTNLGRHLIQAFQPGEVTPEQAHEIGMELAKEILGGKYISARAPDQERFTRLKTLGVDYTEEALAARIAGRSRPCRQPKQQDGKISLLIDIQNNIKAQQSAGFTHWAKLNNLKQAAKTMNFLTEHGISSYGELEGKLSAVSARRDTAHAEIKRIESRSAELTLVMKHAETYRQLKPIYDRYRKSNNKEKFLRGHESEIILFEAAARELKRLGTVPLPTTESMKTELANLNAEKERLLAEYKAARAEAQEYETVKQNVDALLTVAKEQEQQRRHELE